MSLAKWTACLMMSLAAAAAQPPLPDLRVEPTAGGSVLYVRNTYSQPLTAFTIELVGYPGSSYRHSEDNLPTPLGPGAEKRIPVTSMTVGAVPEYVKITAAVYADGTSSGVSQKVTQIIDVRRARLETTRELIRRLEKGSDKPAVVAGLQQWADSLRPSGNSFIFLINQTVKELETRSVAETLAYLRESEQLLAASKPPLQ